MKLAYVKVRDPICWTKPTTDFYQEDLPLLDLHIIRAAGLIIYEDPEKLILGEITTAEDNPKLDEFGLNLPRYRYVMIISKKDILDRQTFELGSQDHPQVLMADLEQDSVELDTTCSVEGLKNLLEATAEGMQGSKAKKFRLKLEIKQID